MSVDFLLHLLATIGNLLPASLGYNFVLGRGKILHFGPVAVGLTSAYSFFITLSRSGSVALAIIVSLIAVGLISCVFAWLALRLEPDGLGILTIAMHLAVLAVILNGGDLTRGALGMSQIARFPFMQSQGGFAFFSLLSAMLFGVFVWWLDRGKLGRKLTALSENTWHAQAAGIGRTSAYVSAFLIAGLGSLITNILTPQYLGLLHPNDYSYAFLILYVMIVVAGGPGRVVGVTLSTVLLVLLKEGLRFVPFIPATVLGPVRLVLFGVILIVAVWVRRDRIFPGQRNI